MPFKKGQSGNPQGRRRGAGNKTTTQLKDAILKAAELTGLDDKGTDGLIGYLQRVASKDLKAFSGLLGKVLPIQVQGDPDNPLVPTTVTFVIKERADSKNKT